MEVSQLQPHDVIVPAETDRECIQKRGFPGAVLANDGGDGVKIEDRETDSPEVLDRDTPKQHDHINANPAVDGAQACAEIICCTTHVPRFRFPRTMLILTLQILAWTAVMAVVLLWPAGTLAYPGGWAFVVLFAAAGSAISFWLYRHNPRLLRERMASPIQREQKAWDRAFLSAFILGFFGWMAFMARDASRSNFAAVPVWLQVVGAVGVSVGFFLDGWRSERTHSPRP
jgi:hypothetical protein